MNSHWCMIVSFTLRFNVTHRLPTDLESLRVHKSDETGFSSCGLGLCASLARRTPRKSANRPLLLRLHLHQRHETVLHCPELVGAPACRRRDRNPAALKRGHGRRADPRRCRRSIISKRCQKNASFPLAFSNRWSSISFTAADHVDLRTTDNEREAP